ncbi:SDR family NAD(P)-dependent oxidoreductase [Rugosimonospora africana]|uniref:SDR family NAD(P)-dependent oxidoreductase n=1 Tax=Rugosimonospora africana TaxID=556532 RepID=UPI001944ECC1|nr:SDR family NAD(P)-dependent oxidoreductase [Rugosimonospora africana]
MTRRWLITGCSSGLGRALARAAADAGDRVLATARRPEALTELRECHPDTVETCALDVRDPDACAAAVQVAVDRFGGVDVLVNNAGCGTLGAVEELTDDEIEAQLQTLLLGPWRMTRLVLPLMRAQGSGHLLMVSSTTGRSAMPGLGAYVASKFALEGMTETLALETAGTGIRVTLLEAGVFATNYGASLADAATRLPAYRPVVDPIGALIRGEVPAGFTLSEPEEFADTVLALVNDAAQPPLRLPLGAGAWGILTEAADRDRAAMAELAVKWGVALPAR